MVHLRNIIFRNIQCDVQISNVGQWYKYYIYIFNPFIEIVFTANFYMKIGAVFCTVDDFYFCKCFIHDMGILHELVSNFT